MKLRTIRFALAAPVLLAALASSAGAEAAPDEEPLQPLIESHYKIAPGKTDEWLHRYTTQHLPILKELQREGRILQITILRPALHQGGPEWHFKVILRFRDFAAWATAPTKRPSSVASSPTGMRTAKTNSAAGKSPSATGTTS